MDAYVGSASASARSIDGAPIVHIEIGKLIRGLISALEVLRRRAI